MRAFYEAWQGVDINLEIPISKLQIADNKELINSPTAVGELETNSAATAAEMPEQFQGVLPDYYIKIYYHDKSI